MGTITTTNDEGVVYYFGEVRKSSPLSRLVLQWSLGICLSTEVVVQTTNACSYRPEIRYLTVAVLWLELRDYGVQHPEVLSTE